MTNSEIIRRYKSLIKAAKLAKGLQLAYYIKQLQELRVNFPYVVGRRSIK